MKREKRTFGDYLRERMEAVGMKSAELSRLSGVSKQNISRLVNNKPHSVTGALPKAEPETVIKLAGPLNWPTDDALKRAGYAGTGDAESDEFARSEFAHMYSRVNKLNAQQQRDFKIAW